MPLILVPLALLALPLLEIGVFIWVGSDGQPAVNLMFFEEKKFTVRFKLMDHTETPHSTSD